MHGFRHTFATLLIENTTVKPKTVQMLLGHSDIRITLDIYTHITKKNQDDAIDALKKLDL
ncbi:tyrosine-type recombinase/integrase [Lactobacillus iners]|uniref:tyrosine-type recombinase/integrase n=1 Tax=Lactobacillus iners TaxID=147802 RepID=UPI0012BB0B65|nr:tyrosine-type recombinase/integrase [Lactobacillus iners]